MIEQNDTIIPLGKTSIIKKDQISNFRVNTLLPTDSTPIGDNSGNDLFRLGRSFIGKFAFHIIESCIFTQLSEDIFQWDISENAYFNARAHSLMEYLILAQISKIQGGIIECHDLSKKIAKMGETMCAADTGKSDDWKIVIHVNSSMWNYSVLSRENIYAIRGEEIITYEEYLVRFNLESVQYEIKQVSPFARLTKKAGHLKSPVKFVHVED